MFCDTVFILCNRFYNTLYSLLCNLLDAVAAIQVVQVVRCTRAHDPWGPTSEDQIAIFLKN